MVAEEDLKAAGERRCMNERLTRMWPLIGAAASDLPGDGQRTTAAAAADAES